MTLDELERAAARHWQAPDTEPLGEWLFRAAQGFTGRANSVLPAGDPGLPLPDAVAAVTSWYVRRGLPPMIAVPLALRPDETARGHQLDTLLAERSWVLRARPAFVMTAAIADLRPPPPSEVSVRLDAEPDAAWHRYRGQAGAVPLPRPGSAAGRPHAAAVGSVAGLRQH